ncbi:hypothetical protein GALMADRAFT_240627 [Galerina marginata CBS 339.88]|uniref:G domain-containing protein n=1 Tax=Galerina marginata (strain CBS 339.88) TaxID=685588 RepID=A0A067TFX4_GALM3|nr:hypothetical protein GALMADRAFT_240627 [Galerina marginata CBS 339.88]
MDGNPRTLEPKPIPKKNLGKMKLYLQSKFMQASEGEWEQYQLINHYPGLNLSSSSYMGHGQAKRIKAEDLYPEDFVIAVMGPSGSGKTTFINFATGLQSGFRYSQQYTNEVDIIRLPVPGSSNIVFVDIPGFDDGDKSDADTLKMIGDWLAKTYRRKIMLGGILYFHRISDNRVGGGSLKNLSMFEALCGKTMLQNVILTTTMWDGIDEQIAMMREGQLKEMYWARILEQGSTTKRFLGTKQSAFQVLETLFNTPSDLQPLLIQKEIVDEHMELNETTAGRKLRSDLKEITKKHRGLLRRMRTQLKPTKDGDSGNFMVLKEEYEDLKELTNLVAYNVQQLELPVGQRIARMAATAFGLKFH